MVGALAFSMVYGLEVQPANDPRIANGEAAVKASVLVAVPGAFLVDLVYILKYVPDWFPGAGFKRKAKEWRALMYAMRDIPLVEAEALIDVSPFAYPVSASLSTEDVRFIGRNCPSFISVDCPR